METRLPGKSAVLFIHSCDVCELRATGVVNGLFVMRVHHVGQDSLLGVLTNAVTAVCVWVFMVIWDVVVDKQQGLLMDVRL